LNKQYLPYLAAILFAFLLVLPGIAAAEDSICTNLNVDEAKKMIEEDNVFVLDVRTPHEYDAAHIEGAVLIPIASLKNPSGEPVLPPEELLVNRIDELPADCDAKILVYCKTGARSTNAGKILVNAGYSNVYNMNEGIKPWIDAGYPVVSSFVGELECADKSTKTALQAKVNNILCHLEKGNDLKAIRKIDNFTVFVDEMEAEGRLNPCEADYLIHISTVHLKDLI
jgi:rhodanese-related sulfurtransferase